MYFLIYWKEKPLIWAKATDYDGRDEKNQHLWCFSFYKTELVFLPPICLLVPREYNQIINFKKYFLIRLLKRFCKNFNFQNSKNVLSCPSFWLHLVHFSLCFRTCSMSSKMFGFQSIWQTSIFVLSGFVAVTSSLVWERLKIQLICSLGHHFLSMTSVKW